MAIIAIAGVISVCKVHAQSIVGGSNLLSQAYLLQLQKWSGSQNLTLYNAFTHVAGDNKTSYDFHNAIDGIGPSFVVLSVAPSSNQSAQIIGG